MTSDSGTYRPESSSDLPDFSQFYTSRVNNEAEHDGRSHAELMEEAVAIARDAWQPESKYEILDVIALGGMGCILRARDLAAQREVAMKVVLRASGDLDLIDRFTREARIVAHLEHPNIVPVHDIGWSIHGDPYLRPSSEKVSPHGPRPIPTTGRSRFWLTVESSGQAASSVGVGQVNLTTSASAARAFSNTSSISDRVDPKGEYRLV